MDLEINRYEMGERPPVVKPDSEFYHVLGEEGIRKMVSRHYDLMRESSIAGLFPIDDAEFEQAKLRSSDFMIQICGGPDYFNKHRGKPMLINRHAPFTIDKEAREIWLLCYKQALLETKLPEHLIRSFWNYINVFSGWMINSK